MVRTARAAISMKGLLEAMERFTNCAASLHRNILQRLTPGCTGEPSVKRAGAANGERHSERGF